jgi:uncharacterized CHY-type Zn-finger protein
VIHANVLYSGVAWRDHLKSKKHRMNSYVDQPITSTEEYIKCGVCNSFMHRSSFDGTDRCNLCKIDRNSEKKHCIICDCMLCHQAGLNIVRLRSIWLNMATAMYNW